MTIEGFGGVRAAPEVKKGKSEAEIKEKIQSVCAEMKKLRSFYDRILDLDKKMKEFRVRLDQLAPEDHIPQEWIHEVKELLGIKEDEDENNEDVPSEFAILRQNAITGLYGADIGHDTKNLQAQLTSFDYTIYFLKAEDLSLSIKNWEKAVVALPAFYYTMLDYAARAKDVIEGGKGDIIDESFIVTEGKGVNIYELMEELMRFMHIGSAKHLGVQVHYPADIPKDVYAHIAPGVMFNKLANVILNPVRKTDSLKARNVWIDTNVEGENEARNLIITVKDDGVGMSSEVKEHVFEGGKSTTKGKGIGLAHADRLFNQMGCSIEVESSPAVDKAGNGEVHTTFTINIPLSA